MDSRWFGLIELLLVFGLILAWAGWQWWEWWTWRQRRRRDADRTGPSPSPGNGIDRSPGDPPP